MEADDKALDKFVNIARVTSVAILLLHVYWFCYPFLKNLGLTGEQATTVIYKLKDYFTTPWQTKCVAFLILCISFIGTKGKKEQKITKQKIATYAIIGLALYFLSTFIVLQKYYGATVAAIYIIPLTVGYLFIMKAGTWLSRLLRSPLLDDVFNEENESFMQETKLRQNEFSVNLPTKFTYKGKEYGGWVNVVNPFRATYVLGTPGSGKSYAVINNFIKQHIEKGFAIYIYDFKYPDLSTIAYNHLLLTDCSGYKVRPQFYVINFDDPHTSHRCNPLNPKLMKDITDSNESATTIMYGLNKTWIQKQGDFFVESAILYVGTLIEFLRIYQNGKYCTFPHLCEILCGDYKKTLPILQKYPELENNARPFLNAMEGEANEQLQGQLASAQIPLLKLISPELYWIMTGDDFTLDLNNPEEPKVLCVGNNPDRQSVYGAVLSLYNTRIVRLINRQDRLKSSVIIDELPTIYFRGLDNLIATGRSNKVSTCLGFQDFAQLTRDYGDKEAKAIIATVGNFFSGMVLDETAEKLSKRFGKIKQRRDSISINRNDTSTSYSTQMDMLVPASKIVSLSQGKFVGMVTDNKKKGEQITQKSFHAEIIVDSEKVSQEEEKYKRLRYDNGNGFIATDFRDENGVDRCAEIINKNYYQIKQDIKDLIEREQVS